VPGDEGVHVHTTRLAKPTKITKYSKRVTFVSVVSFVVIVFGMT
jgi:hypothetical protein